MSRSESVVATPTPRGAPILVITPPRVAARRAGTITDPPHRRSALLNLCRVTAPTLKPVRHLLAAARLVVQRRHAAGELLIEVVVRDRRLRKRPLRRDLLARQDHCGDDDGGAPLERRVGRAIPVRSSWLHFSVAGSFSVASVPTTFIPASAKMRSAAAQRVSSTSTPGDDIVVAGRRSPEARTDQQVEWINAPTGSPARASSL